MIREDVKYGLNECHTRARLAVEFLFDATDALDRLYPWVSDLTIKIKKRFREIGCEITELKQELERYINSQE